MRILPVIGGVATLVGVLAQAVPARAEAATQNVLQLGIGFRYGALLSGGDLNPWRTGLGLDVGYTLDSAIYVGGSFEYFFGDSVTFSTDANSGDQELTYNLWQTTLEGGYDIGLGKKVVIRPKLGLGAGAFMSNGCFGVGLEPPSCANGNEPAFVLTPGATFLLLTRSFSFTLDTRYELAFTDPERQQALLFSFGIGF